MRRFFLAICGFAMFILAGLIAAPIFINFDGYKTQLVATIKALTGVEPIISGSISVAFFPRPVVEVYNVTVPNIKGGAASSIVSVQKIEVGSSLRALLKGQVDIRDITLISPVLELEREDGGASNWSLFYHKTEDSAAQHNVFIPRNIHIRNGTITYLTKEDKISVDYVNSDITLISIDGPFYVQGQFEKEATVVQFQSSIGSRADNFKTDLKLSTNSVTLSFLGSYQDDPINPGMLGKIDISVGNIGQMVDSFFSDSRLLSQINSKEPMQINGDFAISSRKFTADNIEIKADSAYAKGSVEGVFSKDKSWQNPTWGVNFEIDKLNMDTLAIRNEEVKQPQNADGFIDYYATASQGASLVDYHFEMPRDLNGSFKFLLKEGIYHKDKIEDFELDTDIFAGKMNIRTLSLSLPGNSKIDFSGDVFHNGIRPQLTGSINGGGRQFRTLLTWLYPQFSFVPADRMGEYRFSANVTMTPQKMGLSDIDVFIDKTMITGSLDIRPSDDIPVAKANIKIDRLNFDDYKFNEKLFESANDFRQNAKNIDLESSWLRTLNLDFTLALESDDLIYNGNAISNLDAILNIKPGIFNLQRVILRSDITNIDGRIVTDITRAQPMLNISVLSKKFDTGLFIPASTTTPSAPTPTPATPTPWQWSKDKFNFMGLGRFEGGIKFYADTFKHKDLFLKNVRSDGVIEKEVYLVKECAADFNNGKILLNGSVGISSAPSMAISYALSDIDIGAISKALDVQDTHSVSAGLLYSTGVMSTFGKSPSDWVSALKLNAKLSAQKISINGFDLQSIIINAPKLFSAIDLQPIVNKSMNGGVLDIVSLQGDLFAEGPILKAKDFQFITKYSRGAFAGNLDLRTLLFYGSSKFSFIPEPNKVVTLGLDMKGPLNRLTKRIDTSGLEQYITSRSQ